MKKWTLFFILFLESVFCSAQTDNSVFLPRIAINNRIEAKLEQNIIGNAKYPNPVLGFNFEVQNVGIKYAIYGGANLKLNFNQDVSGLYIGPDIGLSIYSFKRINFFFIEFDIFFMMQNFDKINQTNSEHYGLKLGYSHRWQKSGYTIFSRFERNYVLEYDYYMIGSSFYINFKW